EDKAEITDPVDYESLVAGARIVVIGVPKANQGIGAKTDTFPSDKQREQTVAQNEREHRRGKKIQIGKETPERFVVVHVAGGINMDKSADAGDDKNHHRGEWIDHERHVDFERTQVDPAVEIIDEKALLGLEPLENEKSVQRETKGNDH